MLVRLVKTRFRLCDADRDAYGDAPKADDGWVVFDPEALEELPCSQLQEIEATTGFQVAFFWSSRMRVSALGQKAALWIARRQAGAVDVWSTFDPRILRVESEPVTPQVDGGDADPPAPGSAPGSPAAP